MNYHRADLTNTATDRTVIEQSEKGEAVTQAALADYEHVDLSWIDPFPSDSGWTLAPDTLRFIVSVVSHFQPKHIMEFGSGLSTRVFARACANLDRPCAVTSVDNDPELSEQARQHVIDDGVDCSVDCLFAPLVLRRHGRNVAQMLPVYHFQNGDEATHDPADLILIDGPPGRLGGREGVLYQALDFSRAGTLILLDDADREEELRIVERWQQHLGEVISVRQLDGFVKGLAVITVVRSPGVVSDG